MALELVLHNQPTSPGPAYDNYELTVEKNAIPIRYCEIALNSAENMESCIDSVSYYLEAGNDEVFQVQVRLEEIQSALRFLISRLQGYEAVCETLEKEAQGEEDE